AAFRLLLFLVPTFPLAVSMQSEDWFALTLALSPRRGNVQSPRWEESLTGARIAELRTFLPLPGGEGRGEGERLIPLNSYGLAHASEYFPPPDSAGGWRTAKDAAQARELAAMDLSKLEQAFDFTQRCTQNGGLLVVRRGYLVFEKYFGRAHRNANPDMASTGKAYTSIACGMMLQEFRDSIPDGLQTKVFAQKYLPEAFPLDDPRKADITLGQLLCMTAGYNGEGGSPVGVVNGKAVPMNRAPGQNIRELDRSSIRSPLWTDPGAGYVYASPSPHIASIVLRHVSGMELQDYIRERLAKPMGWGAWGYCLHRGDFDMPHANGAGSTALHATDAVRFGYCLRHQGT